jgi:hypothetical protein
VSRYDLREYYPVDLFHWVVLGIRLSISTIFSSKDFIIDSQGKAALSKPRWR